MPQIRSGRRTFAPLLFLTTLLLTTPAEARTAPPTATSAASPTDPRFDAALARADSLLRARSADAASAILDSLIERAGTTDNDEAALRVHLARARLNGLVGRPRLGRESASAALELASARHDTAFVCQALRWLAVAAQQEGSMLEARTHAARLLDLARGRGDRFHQGQGFLLMAYSDRVTGERDAAEGEYLEAVRIFVELDQPVFELMAHQGLAQIYLGHGDIDGARRSDLRVLEGSRRIGDPYGEARALNDLGVLEFTYGDPSTAAGYYTSAFELQVRMGDVPGSVTSAKNLAVLHTYMGEFDEAMRVLEDALARCEAAGLRSQEAAVLEQMAIVRREEGIHAKAVELFRRATERTPGDTPDPLAGILTGLARTLSMRDSTEAGIALMLDRIEPMRDRLSPLTAYNAERTLGDLMLLEDRFAEALERLERAESIARPRGFGFLVGVLALQARCHSRLNHPDSARACLDRAVASWESERGRMRDPIWREQLELDGRLLFTEILRRTLADTVLGSEQERAGRAFESLQRFKTRTLVERMLGASSAGMDSADSADSAVPAGPDARAFERLRGGVQLDDLQDRWLGEDEILLDFFQTSDGVYLFGVTRSDCRVTWIPFDRDTLATVLRRYRQLASTKPGDTSTGAGDAPRRVARCSRPREPACRTRSCRKRPIS